MKIAYGSSRTAKFWQNDDISWEEFTQRCSRTIYTTETLAEYLKLKKSEATAVKDHGGYVLGELKGNTRNSQSVVCRSAIALDMDYGKPNVYEDVIAKLPLKLMVYSTHKHIAEKPRLRIIIPLSRDVSKEEYEPVARKIAQQIGLEMFDPTTFQYYRLMYWPTTPKDQTFFFRMKDGKLVDPDKTLAAYEDWQDSSQWPRLPKESLRLKPSTSKQEDPLTKKGWIGSFCRAYTIEEAIHDFLSDIYEPTEDPDRWHYVPSHSTAGALIYDHKFLFSNHAKDPASGKLCNAFDLVRIHLFGDLDEDAAAETPTNKLPSYLKMTEFASNDTKVRKKNFEDKRDDIQAEFDDPDLDFTSLLKYGKGDKLLEDSENYSLIIEHDPALQNIVYNEFISDFDIIGPVPWIKTDTGWTEGDLAALKLFLEKHYGLWHPGKLQDALLSVTKQKRRYHPIKTYLESLHWDGIDRAESVFIDYLGVEDNVYTRAVTRKIFVAAINRIYDPGCKFDQLPVLVGAQGIGKSTMVKMLGKDWYCDSIRPDHFRDPKLVGELLFAIWIAELPEYDMGNPEKYSMVKAGLSSVDDRFRKAYGKVAESHKRQSIFIATANSMNFLGDETGNRRYWILECHGSSKKPWDIQDIDQYWAEAMCWYETGEDLFLSSQEEVIADEARKKAFQSDDRIGIIQDHLNKQIPVDYDDMDITERRNFFSGTEFGPVQGKQTRIREWCCPIQIWAECFGYDPGKFNSNESRKIGLMIEKTGEWERYSGGSNGRIRFTLYGLQKTYRRRSQPRPKEENSDDLRDQTKAFLA